MRKLIILSMTTLSICLCGCGKKDETLVTVEARNDGGSHSGEERETSTEDQHFDTAKSTNDQEEISDSIENVEEVSQEVPEEITIYGSWVSESGDSIDIIGAEEVEVEGDELSNTTDKFTMYIFDRDRYIDGNIKVTESTLKLEYTARELPEGVIENEDGALIAADGTQRYYPGTNGVESDLIISFIEEEKTIEYKILKLDYDNEMMCSVLELEGSNGIETYYKY